MVVETTANAGRNARTMTAQEIAKAIREAIKMAVKSGELPKARYTVRQTWSGYTPSIRVSIKGWSGQLFNEDWLENECLGIGNAWRAERFTEEAMQLRSKVERIANAWNYDESRLEVDYHCVGYFCSVAFADANEKREAEAKAWGFAGVVAA